jgi:type I restriction enzyme S subunit
MKALKNLPNLVPNADWASLPLFDRSGWTRVRFGDVVENLNETERSPAEAGIDRFIAMEHLEPGSLHVREWGNVADGTTFTRRCRPGQVLFGKRRAYQRKVAVAEFDAVVSGDIYVLAPKDDRLIPELLPFLCLSERFFQHAVGTSAGSLSPRTNWSSLANFEFDIPPLDQQHRIAEILWAVDMAIGLGSDLESAVSAYRAAFLGNAIDLLSKKEICFGSIQDLIDAEIIEPPQDGNHGELHPVARDYVEDGIPFVMANDIRDGRLCLETCKHIKKSQAQRLRIGFAKAGDILLTHKGSVGLTTVVPDDVGDFIMLTPQVTYYRIKDPTRLRPQFLLAAFNTASFQRTLQTRAKQSTRDYIGILAQRDLPVNVPDKIVQDRILRKLERIEAGQRTAKESPQNASRLLLTFINALW